VNSAGHDLEGEFDPQVAAHDLDDYRQSGLPAATRLLLDALLAEGVAGLTVLDIGGGIGAIHHDLIRAGVRSVMDVDGSSAYLSAAQDEAARQGHIKQITYRHGDFVRLADTVEPADIVTLVGVLCCYPDMTPLVRTSAAHARRLYGLVYPRSTWWNRAAALVYSSLPPLAGSGPGFVHAEKTVDATVRAAGLGLVHESSTWFWRVAVYARRSASP